MTVEAGASRGRVITLPARPEPIRVSVEETAIVVVDTPRAGKYYGGSVAAPLWMSAL